jgi:hypothetical protein
MRPDLTLLAMVCCVADCRTRHNIPLGFAGTPGVWLIEAVANGQVVRARIEKGSLRMTDRPTVAGQLLTILDEDWRRVKVGHDATVLASIPACL